MSIEIDFEHRTCPICGAEGFEIKSEENLRGTCGLNIAGPDRLEWDGYTEIDWNSQRTDFFYCGDCDTKLPDEWQTAIGEALGRISPEDDDPPCVCGVHRSEHDLLGCPEGFQTGKEWDQERAFIASLDDDEFERIYRPQG